MTKIEVQKQHEHDEDDQGIMRQISESLASSWGRVALGLSTAGLLVGSLTGCAKVPPGYGGIKVNNMGSQRGVQDFPIVTGFVMYNPITEEVHTFPTFLQQKTWTSSMHEGREGKDESITFNSSEGMAINCDIQVGYSIDFQKIPHIWVDYHKDIEQISEVTVRGWVRDEFSEVAGKMGVADIMGPKKGDLQETVKANLQKKHGDQGFIFQSINIIGEMRVPDTVKQSINSVIQARSKALEAENKVQESRAVAEQGIATARGDSLSEVIRANGTATANQIMTASLTDKVLAQRWLDKWDGKLPSVVGGDHQQIQIPAQFRK